MLDKELEYSGKLLEVIYNCQMCGGCDIACKYAMDMEVLEPINATRIECVKDDHTLAVFENMIASLRKGGPMVLKGKTQKGNWFDGLEIKDYTQQKAEVIYHAGCRTSNDAELWKVAQSQFKSAAKSRSRPGYWQNQRTLLRRTRLSTRL